MKPPTLVILFASLSLLTGGCFSGLYQIGSATSGDSSGSGKVVAATLDVATSPLQAPFWIASARRSERNKRIREVQLKIISDAEYRRALIYADTLTLENADLFAHKEVADSLTEDEVRHLWHKWKDSRTGYNWTCLIISRNTPADVLRDYYSMVTVKARTRLGANYSQDFIYERELLLHPNLPSDILSEIYAFGNPYVNDILKARK